MKPNRARAVFAFLLLVGYSGILPVLGLRDPQSISSYGRVNYLTQEYGFSDFIGGGNDLTKNEQYMSKFIESGAKWVRTDIYGVFDSNLVSEYQGVMSTMHDAGIKWLAIFGKDLIEYAGSGFTLDDWRKYVRQGVTVFDGYVDAIEIWNEPDLPEFHYGYMDGTPEHYFDLLKAAYEEIKSVNASIPVVAGSLCTLIEDNGEIYGGTLLKGIWALGASDYCDVVSIHTYRHWMVYLGIAADEAVQMAYDITGKPIWVTELGYPSEDIPDMGFVGESEETQRDWMNKTFNEFEGGTVKPEVVMWYTFYTATKFPILNSDYSEKLAFQTFKEFARAQ